jgi:hypothetical protein
MLLLHATEKTGVSHVFSLRLLGGLEPPALSAAAFINKHH